MELNIHNKSSINDTKLHPIIDSVLHVRSRPSQLGMTDVDMCRPIHKFSHDTTSLSIGMLLMQTIMI